MATKAEVAQAMAASRKQWDQVRATIDLLARYRGLRRSDFAAAFGVSQQTISAKLKGTTPITPWEADGFAVVLGVERTLLDLEPEAALRELLGKAPRTGSRCKVSADSQAIAA